MNALHPDLKGRVAIVTGASRGIGKALALRLAKEGAAVVIAAKSEQSSDKLPGSIHDTAKEIEAAGGRALAVQCDVRNEDAIRNVVERAVSELGRIDILVNNAGAIPGGSLLDVSEATWRKAWDLKVFGYVNMCRAFYALMKARGHGVIINVVGNAADTHDPEYICGVAGNAALTAFSQSLGSVSARDNIRVIALSPPLLRDASTQES